MVNVKLTLEYDGTNYHGWQIQPEVPTIQEELQKAVAKILKKEVPVTGAARTDQGVHAKCQVVNFKIPCSFPLSRLVPAVNSIFPLDIRAKRACPVEDFFHAQHSAKYKVYRYFIYNRPILHPWLRNYSWWITPILNIRRMQNAASHLVGEHDFSTFQNKGSLSFSVVKCVEKIKIREKSSVVSISIRANGFLYRMARNIVGTLVEVGGGKCEPSYIRELLLAKDRTEAGPTAPPQGLFLWRVGYG